MRICKGRKYKSHKKYNICVYITNVLVYLQTGIMSVGENWTSIQRTWNAQGADFFLQ